MSKWPWLVGGAVVLGTGLALAARSQTVTTAAQVIATKIVEAEKKGVRKVAETVGGVSQEALDNIARYRVWDLVAKYGKFPAPLFMAVLDIESAGTFDPTIYNYYPVDPATGKKDTSKVKVDRATPGAPPVEAWKQTGDGGFAHDPHAVGLGQILDSLRLKAKPPGYGGVQLPYLNDLLDPEKNIAAVAGNLNIQWQRITAKAAAAPDAVKRALLYLAHNQGGGPLLDALNAGVDVTNINALFGAAHRVGKPLAVALRVAARVPVWTALQPGGVG